MRSETVNTSGMVTRWGGSLAMATVLFAASPIAGQSNDMNFFVTIQGPTWGADLPPVVVSDTHCYDVAYAQGFGHLEWRAYLTGTSAEGEGDEIARERIGSGPWYNYYGVVIAQDVAQLHTDENNLWLQSAVTVTGQMAPEGVLDIPWGSELDGGDFTRAGPILCFGVPG